MKDYESVQSGGSGDTETEEKEIPDHLKFWESLDFTITKSVIEEGDIDAWQPRFCSSGTVGLEILNCTGITNEKLYEDPLMSKYLSGSPTFEFILGSAETELDRQLERCISTCFPEQKAHFNMRVLLEPEYNGSSRSEDPEWITLEFRLQLINLLNAQPIYQWFNETKLTKAREFHSSGVRLFKEKRYLDSFHMFKAAYKLSVLARGLEVDNYADVKEAVDLQILCYNNIAACNFQWKNYKNVLELSEKVLDLQPNNVKTLYRKGVSNIGLEEFDLAEKDLVLARIIEPNNRAVNEKLGLAQQLKKSAENKFAAKMEKMFK